MLGHLSFMCHLQTPSDLKALTSGHFLIDAHLVDILERVLRKKLGQQMQKHLWNQLNLGYGSIFCRKCRLFHNASNSKTGDLDIIKNK